MTCEVCGHEQDRGRFCGRCGARVAGAAGRGTAEQGDGGGHAPGASGSERDGGEPDHPRQAWWFAFAVGAVVVVLAVARLVAGGTTLDDSRVAIPSPAPRASPSSVAPGADHEPRELGPVGFSEATDTVLVFDDGRHGALAVDLDRGVQRSFRLPGQRPGDRPFRLSRLGGWLVVGQERVVAVAPEAGLPDRPLGEAATFLPAAEPDQLWLIDDASAGGPRPTWTLIDASRQVLAEVDVPAAGLTPVRGVPGGLAVQDPDGVLLRYDLGRGELVDYLADGPAWIADVTRDRVVWCSDDPCRALTVSAASGEPVATLGSGEVFRRERAWISPDGARLAAAVIVDVGLGVDFRLRIYGVATGEVLADRQLPLGDAYGGWTDAGDQFFSWSHHSGGGTGDPAVLSRWAGGETIEQIHVADRGITGVYAFVVLPRAAVEGLFSATAGGPR